MNSFPTIRMRRLRGSPTIRNMVRETQLVRDDLIMPLFIVENLRNKEEIRSMPGQFRYPLADIPDVCTKLLRSGIRAVILFGIPAEKDAQATGAWVDDGIIQQAVRAIKKNVPEMYVITDVCLCEYMSHGHCGIVDGHRILNDPSLELLARTALSHVRSGADMVAPSDMMDGRVQAIRRKLDENQYSQVPIMAYSAKYASSYYGPFRDAAESAPGFGDRRTYQMDPANARQAVREVELDVQEGADIVMVKPALAYMDIIFRVRERFDVPLAVYNVSGEYAMVKAAAEKGWIDEKSVVLESLTSMKRAGADIIITYHALDVVRWLT